MNEHEELVEWLISTYYQGTPKETISAALSDPAKLDAALSRFYQANQSELGGSEGDFVNFYKQSRAASKQAPQQSFAPGAIASQFAPDVPKPQAPQGPQAAPTIGKRAGEPLFRIGPQALQVAAPTELRQAADPGIGFGQSFVPGRENPLLQFQAQQQAQQANPLKPLSSEAPSGSLLYEKLVLPNAGAGVTFEASIEGGFERERRYREAAERSQSDEYKYLTSQYDVFYDAGSMEPVVVSKRQKKEYLAGIAREMGMSVSNPDDLAMLSGEALEQIYQRFRERYIPREEMADFLKQTKGDLELTTAGQLINKFATGAFGIVGNATDAAHRLLNAPLAYVMSAEAGGTPEENLKKAVENTQTLFGLDKSRRIMNPLGAAAEGMAQDPAKIGSFWQDVIPQGAGSLAPLAMTGGLSLPAQAILPAMANAGRTMNEAEDSGASIPQQLGSGSVGFAIGTTEAMLGAGRFLGGGGKVGGFIERAVQKRIGGTGVGAVTARTVLGATEEATQEYLVSAADNLNAMAFYNEAMTLKEAFTGKEAQQSAMAGFVLGGAVKTMTTLAKAKAKRSTGAERALYEDAAEELDIIEAQLQEQGIGRPEAAEAELEAAERGEQPAQQQESLPEQESGAVPSPSPAEEGAAPAEAQADPAEEQAPAQEQPAAQEEPQEEQPEADPLQEDEPSDLAPEPKQEQPIFNFKFPSNPAPEPQQEQPIFNFKFPSNPAPEPQQEQDLPEAQEGPAQALRQEISAEPMEYSALPEAPPEATPAALNEAPAADPQQEMTPEADQQPDLNAGLEPAQAPAAEAQPDPQPAMQEPAPSESPEINAAPDPEAQPEQSPPAPAQAEEAPDPIASMSIPAEDAAADEVSFSQASSRASEERAARVESPEEQAAADVQIESPEFSEKGSFDFDGKTYMYQGGKVYYRQKTGYRGKQVKDGHPAQEHYEQVVLPRLLEAQLESRRQQEQQQQAEQQAQAQPETQGPKPNRRLFERKVPLPMVDEIIDLMTRITQAVGNAESVDIESNPELKALIDRLAEIQGKFSEINTVLQNRGTTDPFVKAWQEAMARVQGGAKKASQEQRAKRVSAVRKLDNILKDIAFRDFAIAKAKAKQVVNYANSLSEMMFNSLAAGSLNATQAVEAFRKAYAQAKTKAGEFAVQDAVESIKSRLLDQMAQMTEAITQEELSAMRFASLEDLALAVAEQIVFNPGSIRNGNISVARDTKQDASYSHQSPGTDFRIRPYAESLEMGVKEMAMRGGSPLDIKRQARIKAYPNLPVATVRNGQIVIPEKFGVIEEIDADEAPMPKKRDLFAKLGKAAKGVIRAPKIVLGTSEKRKQFGSFQSVPGLIKIRSIGDLYAMMHEYAHWLDFSFGMVEAMKADPQAERELDAVSRANNLGQRTTLTEDQKIQEAFAIWLHQAIMSPSFAQGYTPRMWQMYQSMKASGSPEAQEFMDRFDETGKLLRRYMSATGSEVIGASIMDDFSQVVPKNKMLKVFDGIREKARLYGGWWGLIDAALFDAMQPARYALKTLGGIKGMTDPDRSFSEMMSRSFGIVKMFEQSLKTGFRNFGTTEIYTVTARTLKIDPNTGAQTWVTEEVPVTMQFLFAPLDRSRMKEQLSDLYSYMAARRIKNIAERWARQAISEREGITDPDEIDNIPYDEIRDEAMKADATIIGSSMGYSGEGLGDYAQAMRALEEFEVMSLDGNVEKSALYFQQIEEAASRYRQMAYMNMKFLLKAGRITQNDYDTITNSSDGEYASFARLDDNERTLFEEAQEAGWSSRVSTKLSASNTPVFGIKGSEKTLAGLYSGLLESTYRAMAEANQNRAKLEFVNTLIYNDPLGTGFSAGSPEAEAKKRLVADYIRDVTELDASGNPKKPSIPNIITVHEGGKPRYYQLDKTLYESISKMYDYGLRWAPLIPLKMMGRFLRNNIVLWPVFQANNLSRDLNHMLFYSRYYDASGKNRFSAMKDLGSEWGRNFLYVMSQGKLMSGQARYWQDMFVSGAGFSGDSGYMQYADYRDVVAREVKKASEGRTIADPINFFKRVADWYAHVRGNSEYITRATEFRMMREALEKSNPPESASAQADIYLKAMMAARDLLDFRRGGKIALMVNQILPFTNVAFQSLRKMGSTFADPSTRRQAIISLSLAMTGAAVERCMQYALASIFSDDDEERKRKMRDYFQRPAYQKDMFWNIGGIEFAKPQEVAVMSGLVGRAVDYAMGDKNALAGYQGTIMNVMMPISSMAEVLGPIGSIAIEIPANYNMFFDAPIVPQYEVDLPVYPSSPGMEARKGIARSSAAARAISYLSSVPERIGIYQGASGLGPSDGIDAIDSRYVDHILRGTMGYTGSYLIKAQNFVERQIRGKEFQGKSVDSWKELTLLYRKPPATNARDVLWLNERAARIRAMERRMTLNPTLGKEQRKFSPMLEPFYDAKAAYYDNFFTPDNEKYRQQLLETAEKVRAEIEKAAKQ